MPHLTEFGSSFQSRQRYRLAAGPRAQFAIQLVLDFFRQEMQAAVPHYQVRPARMLTLESGRKIKHLFSAPIVRERTMRCFALAPSGTCSR